MNLFPALAVLAAVLVPLPALGNAAIRVKCSADCKIKIDGKRGEKVSDREWLYEKVPGGIWEVEVSRGFKGGYADIPESGDVEILVSDDTMLVNGQMALDRKQKKQMEKARKEAAEAEKKGEKVASAEPGKDGSANSPTPPPTPTAAPKKIKMAVVGLTAKNMEQSTADIFCDALVGELRKRPNMQITDRSDIATALGAEREKQMLGCTDNSCMAEIGGALGVDLLVRGNVGRVGKILQVFLVLVDSTKGTAVSTVTEQIKSANDEAFFDQLPKLVERLLKGRK
ncbi:MAG TPA: hypothetical protein VGK67_10475 [Myxococcales bacterium]|jgi:TolB-like protein